MAKFQKRNTIISSWWLDLWNFNQLTVDVFRTGPSSLTAIKNGHVYLNYDTKFVFAEVNACKVSWKLSADLAEVILYQSICYWYRS